MCCLTDSVQPVVCWPAVVNVLTDLIVLSRTKMTETELGTNL